MADRPLAGKVAIVTGAGSTIGIGRVMSLALVGAGARVTMTDINKETLEESANVAREIGGDDSVLQVVADVSNPDDAETTVSRTISELGGLHILVNNAGTNQMNLGASALTSATTSGMSHPKPGAGWCPSTSAGRFSWPVPPSDT